MTGLALLKEEMAKRGCNKAQIESKTAAVVLDILSGDDAGRFTDLREAEKDLEERETDLQIRKAQLDAFEKRLMDERKSLEREKKEMDKWVSKKIDTMQKYIDLFEARLQKCETAEGRDLMKRAQFYRNSVNVETPQNNTAYIEGLANILASGKGDMGGMHRMHMTAGYRDYLLQEAKKAGYGE